MWRRIATPLVLGNRPLASLFRQTNGTVAFRQAPRFLSIEADQGEKKAEQKQKEEQEQQEQQESESTSSSSSTSLPTTEIFRSGDWTYETTPIDQKAYYTGRKLFVPTILFLVAVGASAVHWVLQEIKDSGPFRSTFRAVSTDPGLAEILGSPIKASYFVSEKRYSGNKVRIEYNISGPKGDARVFCRCEYYNKEGRYLEFYVRPKENGGYLDRIYMADPQIAL